MASIMIQDAPCWARFIRETFVAEVVPFRQEARAREAEMRGRDRYSGGVAPLRRGALGGAVASIPRLGLHEPLPTVREVARAAA